MGGLDGYQLHLMRIIHDNLTKFFPTMHDNLFQIHMLSMEVQMSSVFGYSCL